MMTEAHACMARKWVLRMAVVSLAFTGFALWCIYDAKVTYPRFNARAAAHNRLCREGQSDQWPAVAAEQGWEARFKDDDRGAGGLVIMKSEWDIGTQYLMMAGCLAVALITVGRILRARPRTMHADDNGFRTIEGRVVPYGDIESLDMTLWQRKSIVTVHYRADGAARTTRIDDWIYEGGEAILKAIREQTGLGAQAEDRVKEADAGAVTTPSGEEA